MSALTAYNNNLSTEEFLQTAFILLKRKVNRIYLLSLETQNVNTIKERFEQTSQVLEALRLLTSSLDFKNPDSVKLSNYYLELQNIIMLGNSSKPELLQELVESF